jgi:hypothetical protein
MFRAVTVGVLVTVMVGPNHSRADETPPPSRRPACERVPGARFALEGPVRAYFGNVTRQWLLPAPEANPAMLAMFRDRDRRPYSLDQQHERAATSSGRGDPSDQLLLHLGSVIIEPFGSPTAPRRSRIIPARRARPILRPAMVLSLVSIMVLQSAAPAWAWGRLGHRVIAKLAERHLTPSARAEIKALL